MKIKLTKRQRELLFMDAYAEYKEGAEPTMDGDKPWGGEIGVSLRNDIRSGNVVEVTPFLVSELDEFADRTKGERGYRDDEMVAEHRVYVGLLKKCKAILESES